MTKRTAPTRTAPHPNALGSVLLEVFAHLRACGFNHGVLGMIDGVRFIESPPPPPPARPRYDKFSHPASEFGLPADSFPGLYPGKVWHTSRSPFRFSSDAADAIAYAMRPRSVNEQICDILQKQREECIDKVQQRAADQTRDALNPAPIDRGHGDSCTYCARARRMKAEAMETWQLVNGSSISFGGTD